ncbi:MAG: sigma-70 family RNA polymerase sigma factor [Bacteroidetes bacterium]|nr:sigma-70 family RNA polymerase sigma factor [Bacteroidota bacterium]
MHYSDGELIEMFHNSDNPDYAFSLIVNKYQSQIYWHIRRLVIDHEDSADIVQDVFVKAWQAFGNFRSDSAIYTWLYRIATNEAISFLNKKKRKSFISFNDVEFSLSEKLEDDNFFNGDEIQKKLQKAILTLPPKQRAVFNLRYYDEMKYEEMAKVLGKSEGALKANYHHAVNKIEEYLKRG